MFYLGTPTPCLSFFKQDKTSTCPDSAPGGPSCIYLDLYIQNIKRILPEQIMSYMQ